MQIIPYEFPEDWDSVEIFPLSDLHVGDENLQENLFRKFVQHIAAAPNRFIIYNGDNLNNAIKSSVSNVYNETMPPRSQRKWLRDELKPVKDRFLCFIAGNHEYRSIKEVDSHIVDWIAESFDVSPYCKTKLEYPFYSDVEVPLKISVGKGRDGKRITYGVYATHGNGGGKFIGGAMNNLENLALTIEGADVVIVGHVHKKAGSIPGVRKMDMQNNKMREIEKACCISSHWSSFGGYAARKMLRPSGKGSVPIILSGNTKEVTLMLKACN